MSPPSNYCRPSPVIHSSFNSWASPPGPPPQCNIRPSSLTGPARRNKLAAVCEQLVISPGGAPARERGGQWESCELRALEPGVAPALPLPATRVFVRLPPRVRPRRLSGRGSSFPRRGFVCRWARRRRWAWGLACVTGEVSAVRLGHASDPAASLLTDPGVPGARRALSAVLSCLGFSGKPRRKGLIPLDLGALEADSR